MPSKAPGASSPASLPREIECRPPGSLVVHPRNARVHPKRQIRKIANSISAFGQLVPIVIDENSVVLKGHATLAAAKSLNWTNVRTVTVCGLKEAQKRAFMLADNRVAEDAGWDQAILADEFNDLADLLQPFALDLMVTGFDPAEIDIVLDDRNEPKPDPADAPPEIPRNVVSRPGDLWGLRGHRILCGDARSCADLDDLMAGEQGRMIFTDPPYNVRVRGHVGGRGRTKHREFALASGEMTQTEYARFLDAVCANLRRVCRDGAIGFICIDWRHIEPMLQAGRNHFAELKNLIVWNKTSAGQGTFYRSQHEFIPVWKVSRGEHINAFELGQHGRSRSNVWTYAGVNSFRAGRADELSMHPTVKPVALVADAIRDCTLKGEIVLDVFLGSGTTIMAAEKTGRRGFGIEYDQAYVDVAIRRWQLYTRADAVLMRDGRSFEEIATERLSGASGGSSDVPQEERGPPDAYPDAQDWITGGPNIDHDCSK